MHRSCPKGRREVEDLAQICIVVGIELRESVLEDDPSGGRIDIRVTHVIGQLDVL